MVMLAITAAGVWVFFLRRHSSFHSAERNKTIDLDVAEPHTIPDSFRYSDPAAGVPNLDLTDSSRPKSSKKPSSRPQSEFSEGEHSQTTGAATVCSSALPPPAPLLPIKAQRAGAARRNSSPRLLHTPTADITGLADGCMFSDELWAQQYPTGNVRQESPAQLAAGTAPTAPRSPGEVVAVLQQEMLDLRRVVQQLHVGRLEAPPQYEG